MRRALAFAAVLAALCAGSALASPDPVSPVYVDSGKPPVTKAFTATGCTAAFTPIAGRDFNVSGWGTFVASWQLYRSFDQGVTLLPITAAGTTLYQWTAPASESASEAEGSVQYFVCVGSYTSGTLNVRISQ